MGLSCGAEYCPNQTRGWCKATNLLTQMKSVCHVGMKSRRKKQ